MKRFMVYLIFDKKTNLPIYIGRGRTRYGDGKRKGWSRIDVHKHLLKRALEMDLAGELVLACQKDQISSLYLTLVEKIKSGAEIDFRIVKETDDPAESVIEEGKMIEAFRVLNPDLIANVVDISGNGICKNRVNQPMSDQARQAISDRMRGKSRGKYNVTPEGREALRRNALEHGRQFDKKLTGLTAAQIKSRRTERAAVLHHVRQARKANNPEKLAQQIARLDEIDRKYGLGPGSYVPKSYTTRARAQLTIEQEQAFCARFRGKSFRIVDFQEEFQVTFERPISVSGAYSMIHRNGLKSNRKYLTASSVVSSLQS
jgi:hypothetical protein